MRISVLRSGLGRIVIPSGIRRTLHIAENDGLEIFVDNEKIIFRKYEPSCACIFCENASEVSEFRGKNICKSCAAEISKS